MHNLSLFEPPAPELKQRLAPKLRKLAEHGVLVGTSSWKYEGWLDRIYTRERYQVRGRFSQKRFEQECIAEYAETFPIVCGDFSFYQFPAPDYWSRLFAAAPEPLQFALKAPEEMTVKWWPQHARYGPRAGAANPAFLDPAVLETMLLGPLEPWRDRVTALIFEFGTFSQRSYEHARDFLADLDRFLAALPRNWRFAVEIRNPGFLAPEYFDCLRTHGVSHVFNAWSRMPELRSQIALPGAFTADFSVARALLRAGRTYEEAVKQFAPYTHVQDANPAGRGALRDLIDRARKQREKAFLFVNNRFEGNALETIDAIVDD